MKPYGLTADLRVRRPAAWEDEIWDGVQSAARDGIPLRRVLQEAEEAWRQSHRDMAKEKA